MPRRMGGLVGWSYEAGRFWVGGWPETHASVGFSPGVCLRLQQRLGPDFCMGGQGESSRGDGGDHGASGEMAGKAQGPGARGETAGREDAGTRGAWGDGGEGAGHKFCAGLGSPRGADSDSHNACWARAASARPAPSPPRYCAAAAWPFSAPSTVRAGPSQSDP